MSRFAVAEGPYDGEAALRTKNWRIVVVGCVLGGLAVAFYLFMSSIASKSNDPVALMQTVGQVSGVAGGLGVAMAVIGLIGKKASG